MRLEDLMPPKEELILKAMAHPALAPKRKPNLEQAMKAVVKEVEILAKDAVTQTVLPLLEEAYVQYTIMNGLHEDVTSEEERENYEAGLDDVVEKVFEPYSRFLSADWLGVNTIDTALWEEDAEKALAMSAGKEVYKTISYNKSDNQVLSAAGIVSADVELFLDQHLNATPEQEKAVANAQQNDLDTLIGKIREHVGNTYDRMNLIMELESLFDDDELLRHGAGGRMGLSPTECDKLLEFSITDGLDEEAVERRVAGYSKADKKPKQKKSVRKKHEKPKPGGVSEAFQNILVNLKALGSVKDAEMGAELGVSRATYNNWVNGKTLFEPDDEQKRILRSALIERINAFTRNLSTIDEVQYEERV